MANQDTDGIAPHASASADLTMLAWQKAYERLASRTEQSALERWVNQLIGNDPLHAVLRATQPVKERLKKWVLEVPAEGRLAACRSQITAVGPEFADHTTPEHELILLLAIHALVQFLTANKPDQAPTLPHGQAQKKEFEVAIAIVAHLFFGQGCSLELRGNVWRVANMIRTDALEPVEAGPLGNQNMARITKAVGAYKDRAQTSLIAPTGDVRRYKNDQGSEPFILNFEGDLDEATLVKIKKELSLNAVNAVHVDKEKTAWHAWLEDVKQELHQLIDTSQKIHQQPKEGTMQKQNPGGINVQGTNINFALGSGNQQTVTQSNVFSADELQKFMQAMQALQGMVKDDAKKTELGEVIQIVQNQESNPTAQRQIVKTLAWLKAVAENTVLVTDTVEAVSEFKGYVATASMALAQYWTALQALLPK